MGVLLVAISGQPAGAAEPAPGSEAGGPRANPFGEALDLSRSEPAERRGSGSTATTAGVVDAVGPPIEIAPADAEPAAPAASPQDAPSAAAPTESRPLGASPANAGGGEAGGSWLSGAAVRTVGALAVVVVLMFLMWAGLRRLAGRSGGLGASLGPGGRAPSGVLSVLARYPVARGQTLVLLHMDRRVLLLCQTSQGFSPLCEVTDPEEVASLLVKTRDEQEESLTTRFNGLLRFFEREDGLSTDEGPGPTTLRGVRDGGLDVPSDPPPARDDGDPVGSLRRRLSALREGAA